MPNNTPKLIDEAGIAYLVQKLQEYTDDAVAEAQQTSVLRSGSKWKDLVDEINYICGTSLGYDDDVDDFVDALRTAIPDPSAGLPANYIKLGGVEVNNGFVNQQSDSVLKLLCDTLPVTKIDDTGGDITSVKAYAFNNCTNLRSVSLPNATSIGQNAFQSCSSLQTVSLPNATSIGQNAFNACSSLQTVSLPNATSIGQSAFNTCSSLQTVSLPNATSIDNYTFNNCTAVKSWELPKIINGLTGTNSFGMNTSLTQNVHVMAASVVSNQSSGFLRGWPYCYLIRLEGTRTTSLNLQLWVPTIAYDQGYTNLVAQQEWDYDDNGDMVDCTQFSNNQEKAVWFFINVFLPHLTTNGTGLTLTLKSTVYDVIINESAVTDWVNNTGWTIARVA